MAYSLTLLRKPAAAWGAGQGRAQLPRRGQGRCGGRRTLRWVPLGPLLLRLCGERRCEQPRPAGTTTPSAPRRGPAETRAAALGAEFPVRPQHERQRGGRRLRRGDHQPDPQTLRSMAKT
ncbi:synaptojanin-2-binding protein isoform X2 [Oenanthe melanoleuca]|uniref:synaptojanin-2-binding protein isoform X2 n=1 Tax=Oenanthe melanoleuca TaxID=2939378 RepID=UPI0024C19E23|nr:synaptojanin-2-binding protein isoform X2 [Oenanthe melanoleuca]